jgi:hypothetical protein
MSVTSYLATIKRFLMKKLGIVDATAKVYGMLPSEWLALGYMQRINTVKLFMKREYPADVKGHEDSPFIVFVEDAAQARMQQMIKEGINKAPGVPLAMLEAATFVSYKAMRRGVGFDDVMSAIQIFNEKDQRKD